MNEHHLRLTPVHLGISLTADVQVPSAMARHGRGHSKGWSVKR